MASVFLLMIVAKDIFVIFAGYIPAKVGVASAFGLWCFMFIILSRTCIFDLVAEI